MAGVYRPRHPERTVLYRVLFHHFDRSPCRRPRRAGNIVEYFVIRRGAGVNRHLAAAEGFLARIRSAGAVFAVIDIAARPEI